MGAADAFSAIDAIAPVSEVDTHFLRAITCHVQQKPAEVLLHIEQGLDALMQTPWCRVPLVNEALNLLGELAKTEVVQDPRFITIFEKLDRDYPVQVARNLRLGMRCDMAMRLPLARQMEALESMGQPFPWNGRALAMRVSAYLQAGDSRLDSALVEMNRYLDQGGTIGGESPPFVVEVKTTVPKAVEATEMVLGTQTGGE